jgi:2-methylcitrate dehydratase PrpD
MSANQEASVTRLLAEAGTAYRFEQLPVEVVTVAKQCFLDWIGVALAGSVEPAASLLREEVLELEANPRGVTLVGSEEKTSVYWATLVNGTASHALDFDDVHAAMGGHPSVPVFPALLALAETRRLAGRDFITAFVAGFETQCRIGALVMPGHYRAGWHTTGTVGTFGAAAACAHALGLSSEQWLHAFGIAGTSAAGLKSMFGTMCKPLHAGKAALNGLMAARLAARDFESNRAVLEAEQGFCSTHATSLRVDEALAGLGEKFHIRDVLFKYHAACFFTHASIQGLLNVRDRHGFVSEQLESVLLRVPPNHLSACNIAEPRTPLEGKFSLRFTAALALSGGDLGESAFSYENVRNPELASIRDKVIVEPSENFKNNHSGEVVVTLRDGTVLSETVDMEIPESDLARQWSRLIGKYRNLATPILGERRTDSLLREITKLERTSDMSEVISLCVPLAK